MNERCVFHIPYHIDTAHASGSQIRPVRMIEALQKIGYQVDVVMGYAEERAAAIKRIKQNIKSGINYAFVYSESSTMPTLLTEKHHLPTHPWLDFGFLKFCRRNGVPVGLFYRDIYWRFPIYKEASHGVKYAAAQLAYRYDLRQYRSVLSRLFLPSLSMAKYLRRPALGRIAVPLPPGAVEDISFVQRKQEAYKNRQPEQRLKLFYVGGIGGQYIFDKLFRMTEQLEYIDLTVCCRADEWDKAGAEYKAADCNRLHVIHESGAGLEQCFEDADICMAWFQTDEYLSMAMPVKIFEYLGKAIPIIAAEGTAAGSFVAENGIGWTIPYDEKCLAGLLQSIYEDSELLLERHLTCEAKIQENTWEARAAFAAKELTNLDIRM